MRYTVRRRLGAWQAYHALLCRMLYLMSHAARASCPSCPVACAVVTIAAAATHRHAWPPPPRDRMPHTAAVSQSLWRAPPLAAFRTLVPHTARSSRPACRISHRLPLVSPRFATTASRPHAARDRCWPVALARAAQHTLLSRILGRSVCAMPRSVRYAIVASARRRVLCIAWSVRYAHGPLPERMYTIKHQSHTGRSHTRYVWSGRACIAEDLWKRVCLTAD